MTTSATSSANGRASMAALGRDRLPPGRGSAAAAAQSFSISQIFKNAVGLGSQAFPGRASDRRIRSKKKAKLPAATVAIGRPNSKGVVQ